MVARKSELKFDPHPVLDLRLQLSPLAVVGGLSSAVALLLVPLVPVGQVLPIFSLAAMAASVASGLAAYFSRHDDNGRPTASPVAGAFMLLGCVAGMLSGAEQVADLFDIAPEKR